MKLEGRFVRVDLDQEEKAWITCLLVNVEPVASRLRIAADPRVAQQPLAKLLNDVLANSKVSGVKDCHGAAVARSGSTGCQTRLRARCGVITGDAAHNHAHDVILRRIGNAPRSNESPGLENGDPVTILEDMIEIVAD